MSSQNAKVAIVTGASQGIGASIAEAFRKIGYGVVANSRSIAPSSDEGILAVPGDIAEAATAERIIAAGMERFGRVDTLINNAGIFIAKPFTEYTQEDYAAVTRVNLDGFFYITQLAIEQMLSQGGGHIVSITSSLVDNADSRVPSVLASLTKGVCNPLRNPSPSSTPHAGFVPTPSRRAPSTRRCTRTCPRRTSLPCTRSVGWENRATSRMR